MGFNRWSLTQYRLLLYFDHVDYVRSARYYLNVYIYGKRSLEQIDREEKIISKIIFAFDLDAILGQLTLLRGKGTVVVGVGGACQRVPEARHRIGNHQDRQQHRSQ
jgi:hypothetical protein